jgi:hypothetical protein
MRIWRVVALSSILGVCLGLGVTWAEFRESDPLAVRQATETVGPPPVAATEKPAFDARQSDGPIAKVDSDIFNFGFMEIGTDLSHEFVITNVGRAPLVIRKGETSCKCTLSSLADEEKVKEVAPGDHATVTLAWHASGTEREFRQKADLYTNDPAQLTISLYVEGQITRSTVIQPPNVVFSSVSPNQGAMAEVYVYSYRDKPFDIVKYKMRDAGSAEYFDVECVPLIGDALTFPGAKMGYVFRIKVKPTIPVGPIQQVLEFETTHDGMATASVPVTGKVVSDFSIAGRGWDGNREALRIGVIPAAGGADRTLSLIVRGPGHEQTKFEVENVEPPVLQVEVGAVTTGEGSAVSLAPLKIRIPPGSAPCNHMGSEVGPAGNILLKTNRPDMPHVRIDVLFAIGD